MATADQIKGIINSLPADSADRNTFQTRLQSLNDGTGLQGDNLDTLLNDVNNVLAAADDVEAVAAVNGDGDVSRVDMGGRRRKYSRRGRRSAKKSGGTRRKQKRRQRRGSRRAY